LSRQNILKVLLLSLILSSCGLIEKWKTPEQPTDSKTSAEEPASNSDDLFAKSMNDSSNDTALKNGTDAPSNTANSSPGSDKEVQDDLKQLEAEFSGNTSATTAKEVTARESNQNVKVEEALPEIKEEVPTQKTQNLNAGKKMSYTVQKGETLMQIAFKIYGDISMWKQLKAMNNDHFEKKVALRAGMKINYTAPEKEFVWNPEGTPYLIKNGDTLGIISNSVYQTPKKWKKIWENNKPLINNPNMIFAGFTLYYKTDGMANYVQPTTVQKKVAAEKIQKTAAPTQANIVEEVKVEKALTKIEESATEESTIDLTQEVQSAPIRDLKDEIKSDEQIDEALSK
jgi:nucleoid-associated protein YgaU